MKKIIKNIREILIIVIIACVIAIIFKMKFIENNNLGEIVTSQNSTASNFLEKQNSIAVNNACNEIKAIVDEVIGSVDEDGVAKFLNTLK